jgi:hypothetical protein
MVVKYHLPHFTEGDPPMSSEIVILGRDDTEARYFLLEKQQQLVKLKENLTHAQAKMKKYADKKGGRVLGTVDMVYLKMQPYRMVVFGIRQSIKLTSKYYGP